MIADGVDGEAEGVDVIAFELKYCFLLAVRDGEALAT